MRISGAWRNVLSSMALFLGLLLALSAHSLADTPKPLKGVALIIGQSKYQHLNALPNPANDAREMEKTLRALGFEPTVLIDLNTKKLQRDLANFAADAEGADVAVVYYSGHGIEAGGENWLVPVDADLQALDDAGNRLVAIGPLLDELKATVPVTLLFLDACRSNPFPAGALLKRDGEAVPVSAAGLALSKGVTAADAGSGREGLGTIIGFAAEPGRVALDGEAGGNSPYASALLRHLAAMNGAEFGTVMRMVTEEVYLKTQGQQRPWVNETLTKLLYFGAPAQDLSSDDGVILGERRQLLLTIAALPDFERKQVEAAAQAGGVPMDALYGMLRTLGADIPRDAVELDKLLKAQSERLKTILAERAALQSEDPEIVRLSALADKALADGALDANVRFREAAKARFAAIAGKLDAAEADLKARRIEGGELFARAAEAYDLKADYLAAAENYAKAFEQVEKWDRKLAQRYRSLQAHELLTHGDRKGVNGSLESAITAYRAVLDLASRDTDKNGWATAHNNLGIALRTLGERESGTARLEEAVVAYRAALGEWTRERVPLDWARVQNNLGNALQTLGTRESGTARLEEAVVAYRAAQEEWTRERVPLDWAMAQNNLGNALLTLGERESGTARLEEAVVAYHAALEEYTRERVPLYWATAQYNLGNALSDLGERESGTARLAEAVLAYRAALEERTPERVPLDWATAQNYLGWTLKFLGERKGSRPLISEGKASVQAAWDMYKSSGYTQYDAYFAERIAAFDVALAALK